MLKPKRVLCIHDLAALGRASLSAIVPALSATGCQPIMLPTALLSAHTGGLGTPAVQDTTNYGMAALESYAALGEEFDCIYAGYLADCAQAELVKKAFALWPDALRIVDPVMGDHGVLYKGISQQLCSEMKTICAQAQLIFPNATEAAVLLDEQPSEQEPTPEQAQELTQRLNAQFGCDVVLTGTGVSEQMIGNTCLHDGQISCISAKRCVRNYPGTGDLFAAVAIGKLLGGDALPDAVQAAADFVSKAAFASPSDTRYGVCFEPFLGLLTPPPPSKVLNIVLIEPRIPQNTGNISRTCAATGARLHLVGPMGFTIDDKKLKRAGLDYWHLLDITYYDSTEEFFQKNQGPFYYFTTKAPARYCDVTYPDGAYLVFGREDAGLPEQLLHENQSSCVRMPMKADARSLNLSNTVAIGVYEVLRQWDFDGLLAEGHLRNYEWK